MDKLALLQLLFPVRIPKFHRLSSVVCVIMCVHVRGQTVDGYRHLFPVVLRCACPFVVAHVSSGPAHVSVAQARAADGHAETCSVQRRDIFGLLNFLFKSKRFWRLDCPFSTWLLTFYS